MGLLLTLFRLTCYWALWIFSAVTIGLTAARLHYTLHLPPHDPLNHGVNFFDGIIVEVLVTACLTMIFTPVLLARIHRRHEYGFLSTFGGELVGLLLLFTLWIVGAAVATQKWGNLSWCHMYSACRILTATVAFIWMSCIMVFFLTIACIGHIVRYNAFNHPVHGGYFYQDQMQQV
jgi:hypothetical protein